jgi:hypothetical protein
MPTDAELRTVRDHLLTLHKALLDAERGRYEKAYGPVRSPGEMLQLVLGNEHFAWLRTYSGLIVRIDEWLASDERVAGEAEAFWNEALVLTTPADVPDDTAAGRYRGLLDTVPTVAAQHASIRKVLGLIDPGDGTRRLPA